MDDIKEIPHSSCSTEPDNEPLSVVEVGAEEDDTACPEPFTDPEDSEDDDSTDSQDIFLQASWLEAAVRAAVFAPESKIGTNVGTCVTCLGRMALVCVDSNKKVYMCETNDCRFHIVNNNVERYPQETPSRNMLASSGHRSSNH